MLWKKLQNALQKSAPSSPCTPSTSQTKAKTFKQRIGDEGEQVAADYVKKQGMRILHRNWRHASLEIDIIAEDEHGIVFIEVKTRKHNSMAHPLDGVHAKKQKILLKAAQVWLTTYEAWEKPCRFAVAAVTYEEHPVLCYKVEFYDNAFDFSSQTRSRSTLGGGNTSWQPW